MKFYKTRISKENLFCVDHMNIVKIIALITYILCVCVCVCERDGGSGACT